MIETLDGMELGTLGFRATGKVTGEEYREVLLPAMRAAAEAGEVRMVFVVGPDFEAFDPGALLEDTKAGVNQSVLEVQRGLSALPALAVALLFARRLTAAAVLIGLRVRATGEHRVGMSPACHRRRRRVSRRPVPVRRGTGVENARRGERRLTPAELGETLDPSEPQSPPP